MGEGTKKMVFWGVLVIGDTDICRKGNKDLILRKSEQVTIGNDIEGNICRSRA